MSCCAPGAEVALATADPHTEKEEVRLASRAVGNRENLQEGDGGEMKRTPIKRGRGPQTQNKEYVKV
jgi:hypothetical protein